MKKQYVRGELSKKGELEQFADLGVVGGGGGAAWRKRGRWCFWEEGVIPKCTLRNFKRTWILRIKVMVFQMPVGWSIFIGHEILKQWDLRTTDKTADSVLCSKWVDKCCISRLRAPNQIELMKHFNPFHHLLHQKNSCNIVVFFKIFSCYYMWHF